MSLLKTTASVVLLLLLCASGGAANNETEVPSITPWFGPSLQPSIRLSTVPTGQPSFTPSDNPSVHPSFMPSENPTLSLKPTISMIPSLAPSTSVAPSSLPSVSPSSSPTISNRPTFSDPIKEDDDDEDLPIAAIVIAMSIALAIPMCCGCNRSNMIVDDFTGAEDTAARFRQDILDKKRLVVSIPPLKAGCIETKTKKTYILFYSTRVKAHWLPAHTYLQLALGWLGFATTVVGVFAPSNAVNSVFGFAALFASEFLTHTWYGYLRYLVNGCCGNDDDSDMGDTNFEDMKYVMSALLHNGIDVTDDQLRRNERILDILGFPFYAVMYLTTYLTYAATLIFLRMACKNDDDNGRRRRRSKNDDDGATVAISAIVGIAMGCFAYPFIFLLTTSASGKIFASFMHHCVSEYYEAKLFHRTPWEFFLAVCTKALTDIVGMEFDHDDLEAGVGGGDVQDEFDLDDVDLDVEKIEEKDESPEKPMSQSLDPDMEEPTNAAAKGKEEKQKS